MCFKNTKWITIFTIIFFFYSCAGTKTTTYVSPYEKHLVPKAKKIVVETKAGETRVVAIFAKRARGMMADYIIRNRIERPEDLKKFKLGGYKFDKDLSDDKQWTFERPQP